MQRAQMPGQDSCFWAFAEKTLTANATVTQQIMSLLLALQKSPSYMLSMAGRLGARMRRDRALAELALLPFSFMYLSLLIRASLLEWHVQADCEGCPWIPYSSTVTPEQRSHQDGSRAAPAWVTVNLAVGTGLLKRTSSNSVFGQSSFASLRSEEISFYCCLNIVVISELCSHNHPVWLISLFSKPICSKDLIRQAETYLPPLVWPLPYHIWCL